MYASIGVSRLYAQGLALHDAYAQWDAAVAQNLQVTFMQVCMYLPSTGTTLTETVILFVTTLTETVALFVHTHCLKLRLCFVYAH